MAPSPLDRHLQTTDLLDCQGRVTHSLTVEPDGTVTVRVHGIAARVQPATRVVHPPGFRLGAGEYSHEQILDLAGELVRTMTI